MTIEITPENVYMGITCLLLVLQVWQYYQLDKTKKEIKKYGIKSQHLILWLL